MSDWEEYEETYLRRIKQKTGSMKVSGKEVFTLEKELNKSKKGKKKRG